ncbi:MAG: MOSC domain-containing protein [Roseobacter sp.]
MSAPLKDMIARFAQPGRLAWIGVRPERRGQVVAVDTVHVAARGLDGDHGASDKRAVTLMQAEHLPVIAAMLGAGVITPDQLRRNLLVQGLNLNALKGRSVRIGEVVLEITGICAPCSRMEETLGHGGYSAVRGHGGWCARVIQPGSVEVGQAVTPLTTALPHSL